MISNTERPDTQWNTSFEAKHTDFKHTNMNTHTHTIYKDKDITKQTQKTLNIQTVDRHTR